MSDAQKPTSAAPPAYPLHRVLGIVDQPAAVEGVVTALTDAGVPADAVEVVCGATAKHRLDAFRAEHGVKSQLIRIAQAVSDERTIADRYEQAVRANHFLVVAPAADAEQGRELGEVMKERGGHFVNYYGRNTITTIAP